ncbi:hypothetical protein [Agathobaculum desmolans]|uniref:hypothetical protein n=1 Tax=Agathobaculum desmolans TaxID=39484 RepID=UPI0004E132D5|nr:hypothetical protein [Agathobaculum desmolans]
MSSTRGSAHKTAFATQMHKKSGQVPDFLYFEREKVSVQELFLVHVWRSPNIDCRKNEVFRQSRAEAGASAFFCPQVKKRKIQCGITVEAGRKKGRDNRERGEKTGKITADQREKEENSVYWPKTGVGFWRIF